MFEKRVEFRSLLFVLIALTVMGLWALGISGDRWLVYSAARKQSRQFAPVVAGALREGKLNEAIRIADRYKKSHLAKVIVAGLQEFQSRPSNQDSEAWKQALDRAALIVHAELKHNIPDLRLIAVLAPVIGLVGTLLSWMEALREFEQRQSSGFYSLANGIAVSFVPLAVGFSITILAYWSYNSFSTSLEMYDLEMRNSISELVGYFSKRATQPGMN